LNGQVVLILGGSLGWPDRLASTPGPRGGFFFFFFSSSPKTPPPQAFNNFFLALGPLAGGMEGRSRVRSLTWGVFLRFLPEGSFVYGRRSPPPLLVPRYRFCATNPISRGRALDLCLNPFGVSPVAPVLHCSRTFLALAVPEYRGFFGKIPPAPNLLRAIRNQDFTRYSVL